MEQELLSIGIDVGTSTTQVVFCCLHLEEEASYGRAPHVKITDKKVIYLSFSGRKAVDCACLNVGGRLLRVENNKICKIEKSMQILLDVGI